MQTLLPVAASLVFGVVSASAVQAAPAVPAPGVILGDPVTTVDWHPSTSHWDHHFHSHQNSMQDREPTEIERQIRQGRGDVRSPRWSGYPLQARQYGRVPRY